MKKNTNKNNNIAVGAKVIAPPTVFAALLGASLYQAIDSSHTAKGTAIAAVIGGAAGAIGTYAFLDSF